MKCARECVYVHVRTQESAGCYRVQRVLGGQREWPVGVGSLSFLLYGVLKMELVFSDLAASTPVSPLFRLEVHLLKPQVTQRC